MNQPVVPTPRTRPSTAGKLALLRLPSATVLALIAIRFGWRGSDLPAGAGAEPCAGTASCCNSQWFGGHATFAYSVLSPILGAITGPVALARSGVAAAVLFERCALLSTGVARRCDVVCSGHGDQPHRWSRHFGLGVAPGLAAVYALQRKHPVAATICAVLCSLSSPLAGALRDRLAGAAHQARRDAPCRWSLRGRTPADCAARVVVPTPGNQPYEPGRSAGIFLLRHPRIAARGRAVCSSGCALRWQRPCRISFRARAETSVVASISHWSAAALLPAGAPCRPAPHLCSCGSGFRRSTASSGPTPTRRRIPRTTRSMLKFIEAQRGPIGRAEIPSTYRHWSRTRPRSSLARGWERQLDIAR